MTKIKEENNLFWMLFIGMIVCGILQYITDKNLGIIAMIGLAVSVIHDKLVIDRKYKK